MCSYYDSVRDFLKVTDTLIKGQNSHYSIGNVRTLVLFSEIEGSNSKIIEICQKIFIDKSWDPSSCIKMF